MDKGKQGFKYIRNDETTGNTWGTQLRQIRHDDREEANLNALNMEHQIIKIKQKQ